jgi:hypothetical protein
MTKNTASGFFTLAVQVSIYDIASKRQMTFHRMTFCRMTFFQCYKMQSLCRQFFKNANTW